MAPIPVSPTTSRDSLGRRLEERIAAGALDVPIFPDAARRLMGACEQDDCDMSRMAEVVRGDPALAAHFLRIANSSLFGGRSAIVGLAQALARLGTNQTRRIALLVTCQARVFASKTRAGAASELRRHAVASAVWAQEIARLRKLNVEEAFLCGLLGDVGIPALWQLADGDGASHGGPEDAAEVDSEIARLHDVASSDIVRAWGLSSRVVEVIRHHHAPLGGDGLARSGQAVADVVAIVQLADTLARATVKREQNDLETVQAHASVAALSLYGDDVVALLDRASLVGEAIQVFA